MYPNLFFIFASPRNCADSSTDSTDESYPDHQFCIDRNESQPFSMSDSAQYSLISTDLLEKETTSSDPVSFSEDAVGQLSFDCTSQFFNFGKTSSLANGFQQDEDLSSQKANNFEEFDQDTSYSHMLDPIFSSAEMFDLNFCSGELQEQDQPSTDFEFVSPFMFADSSSILNSLSNCGIPNEIFPEEISEFEIVQLCIHSFEIKTCILMLCCTNL